MIAQRALRFDVEYVCRNLRAISAAEAQASVFAFNPVAFAEQLLCVADRIALHALKPLDAPAAALVGIGEVGPGRANMLFLATEEFPSIAFGAQRWWRRSFVPAVLSRFRRVEFTGSLPDTPSGRWLVHCGFACEGIARSYGKNGEDFAYWAWFNPLWSATVDAVSAPVMSASA